MDVLIIGRWVPVRGVLVWRTFEPDRSRIDELIRDTIACPTCLARPYQRCRNPGGSTRIPHGTRLIGVRCLCGEPVEPNCLSCEFCRVQRRRETWREGRRRSDARKREKEAA